MSTSLSESQFYINVVIFYDSMLLSLMLFGVNLLIVMINLQICSRCIGLDEHLVSKAKKFKEAFLEQTEVTAKFVSRYESFKFSNGWLEKFKNMHQIQK